MTYDLVFRIMDQISLIGWTITYVALTYHGIKHKACGMPVFCLIMNFSWEIIAVVAWHNFSYHLIWLLADVGILYCYIRFGKQYWPESLPVSFAKGSVLLFVTFALLVCLGWLLLGSAPTAFIMNATMSVLFCVKRKRAGNNRGTSIVVGLGKLIGTACAIFTVLYSSVCVILGLICAIFDLYYCYLILCDKQKKFCNVGLEGKIYDQA